MKGCMDEWSREEEQKMKTSQWLRQFSYHEYLQCVFIVELLLRDVQHREHISLYYFSAQITTASCSLQID